MTFAEFYEKHQHIPRYKTPGSPGWLDFIDDEVRTMQTDYPPVTSWDNVPVGTPVFVRWMGGNRGMYVRTANGLSCDPSYHFPLPLLGQTRCDDAAWIDIDTSIKP